MKKLLFLIFLLCTQTFSQNVFEIHPVISTTAVNCVTTSGSDTVRSLAAGGLSSVTKGMRLVGVGIPFGSYVTKVIDTTKVEINVNATATDDTVSVQWGYFTSLAYAAGDALGFPFGVPTMKRINQIVLIDDADVITSAEIAFYNDTFTETADNAAFSVSDADEEKFVGYLIIGGTGGNDDLGGNKVMWLPPTQLPFFMAGSGKMYAQLMVVGSPTFTAVTNLTLKIYYE
jgi:hypothetical protein